MGRVDAAWIPPRPTLDSRGLPLADNNSGEDFLYMNRWLIGQANEIYAAVNEPPGVQGWRRVPPPDDPDYPVPEFPDSGLEALKSDYYYVRYLSKWERLYTDADYLRTVTLGQLGSQIEFTICNDLHLRWAAPSPVGYRPTKTAARTIELHWDTPAYDYLGDIYASHVNPLFWKLRGWVDGRVDDWARAHGIAGEPVWATGWIGATGFESAEGVQNLERVYRIISASWASDVDGFLKVYARHK